LAVNERRSEGYVIVFRGRRAPETFDFGNNGFDCKEL